MKNNGFKKGHIVSMEMRKKMSESHKGLVVSKEIRKKISRGLKKAIREGNFFTKKHRKKISESKKGENNALFGTHPSKETLLKRSKALKGKKAWNKGKKCPQLATNYQGGISTENELVRHSIEFRLWREAVFARDNWICQKTRIRGGKLHPHHIQNFAQYPELRFAIDNGVTLSKKAHREFHKKYGQSNNTKKQLEEFLNE